MEHPVEQLRDMISAIIDKIYGADLDHPRPTLERPRNPDHGTYATNAAMLIAKSVGERPYEVAEQIIAELEMRLGKELFWADTAGPGFINIHLSDIWHERALIYMLSADGRYGAGLAQSREDINLEFVSANPTGPMHLGHARNAAFGDAIGRILGFVGHRVTREFYINDYGSQVTNLGRSVQARARGEDVPDDGYKGDYVATLALEIERAAERPLEDVAAAATAMMVERAQATLHAFGVEFDIWFSERSLHEVLPQTGESGVEHGLDVLWAQGYLYEDQGALWLRTTAFADDKDRVLRRSNGDHTYFASDIAYAQHKRERGYTRMIYVLGADHHGYVARMKAAYEALGGAADSLELLIMQFVHLVRGGEKAQMSKRSGQFVTLDDLIEEIGVDAARWFLLNRSHDTTIEVDIELATSESTDNPVYYVQYAHARIARIMALAGEERVAQARRSLGRLVAVMQDEENKDIADEDLWEGLETSECLLIARLLDWRLVVAEAAERRSPHRVAAYVLDLAQVFSAFYRDCKVIGITPVEHEQFRLALAYQTQLTIATALDLLGVSAPLEM